MTAATDRAACKAAHPAGSGRPVVDTLLGVRCPTCGVRVPWRSRCAFCGRVL